MEAAIALSRVVRGKGAEAVERISSSFPGLYDALAARMVAEPSLPVRKELLRAIGAEPLHPNEWSQGHVNCATF